MGIAGRLRYFADDIYGIYVFDCFMYIKSDTFGSYSNFDHHFLCTLFNRVRDCETLATWQQANDSSAEALMPFYPRRLNLPGWPSSVAAPSNTTYSPTEVDAIGYSFTIRRP